MEAIFGSSERLLSDCKTIHKGYLRGKISTSSLALGCNHGVVRFPKPLAVRHAKNIRLLLLAFSDKLVQTLISPTLYNSVTLIMCTTSYCVC